MPLQQLRQQFFMFQCGCKSLAITASTDIFSTPNTCVVVVPTLFSTLSGHKRGDYKVRNIFSFEKKFLRDEKNQLACVSNVKRGCFRTPSTSWSLLCTYFFPLPVSIQLHYAHLYETWHFFISLFLLRRHSLVCKLFIFTWKKNPVATSVPLSRSL